MFYRTHFHYATTKAEEVDRGYKRLRGEFGKISKLTDDKQMLVTNTGIVKDISKFVDNKQANMIQDETTHLRPIDTDDVRRH